MAEVSTTNLVHRSTGTPLTYAATAETVETASVPALPSGHKIPLTDEQGRLYDHQMPVPLTEEEMSPPVDLVLLFENGLA
jgi:hypothetical protein